MNKALSLALTITATFGVGYGVYYLGKKYKWVQIGVVESEPADTATLPQELEEISFQCTIDDADEDIYKEYLKDDYVNILEDDPDNVRLIKGLHNAIETFRVSGKKFDASLIRYLKKGRSLDKIFSSATRRYEEMIVQLYEDLEMIRNATFIPEDEDDYYAMPTEETTEEKIEGDVTDENV